MTVSAPEILSSAVCHLDGPNIPSADIEWAMDIPAGRCIIEWVVAQLEQGLHSSSDTQRRGGQFGSMDILASLEAITLDDEEVQMYVESE